MFIEAPAIVGCVIGIGNGCNIGVTFLDCWPTVRGVKDGLTAAVAAVISAPWVGRTERRLLA